MAFLGVEVFYVSGFSHCHAVSSGTNDFELFIRSIMISPEITDSNAPHDESFPKVQRSASAELKPMSTADTSITPPGSVAPTSSPPPSNIDMAVTQDQDAPPLPERTNVPEPPVAPVVPSQPPQDPQVASLQTIFPDFDIVVLQSVLESVGGNQDRAVDTLLGMSDPNYVPQEHPVPIQSQTDLDEEFARRLMLEDQELQQHWPPHQPQGIPTPYQPRIRGRHQQPLVSVNPQGGQQEATGDFQEQFAKIADTGKKTFTSLFSKVKAKVQEFDHQRMAQSSAPTITEPSWSSGSNGGPPNSQSYHESQQAYYDPNPRRQSSSAATPGYDVTPLPNSAPAPADESSPTLHAGTPPPPQTSTGAPVIDPGKLGMLPKRAVSLLRDPSTPAPKPDDDDDELEYAENPFEEHK